MTGSHPPRRAMGAYLIATVLEGEVDEYCRRVVHRCGPGDVLYVNPDEVFGGGKLRSPRSLCVGLSIEPAAFMAEVRKRTHVEREPLFRRFSAGNDPAISGAIERLVAGIDAQAPEATQRTLFDALMNAVIPGELGFEARAPNLNRSQAAILQIKEHLRAHFAEKIMLEDLVAASGLSRFHLVRTFTAEVGLPPHTYQVSLRVDRARALIRGGASPVTVATKVGFADQSHLTRHFKRRVGMTPGAYAQSVAVKR